MSCLKRSSCNSAPGYVSMNANDWSQIIEQRNIRSGLIAANHGLEADFGLGSEATVQGASG